MNNLKLSTELTSTLYLRSDNEVLLFSAYDIERNRLFFASSANLIYKTHISSFQNERASRSGLLAVEIDSLCLEPEDFITGFDYLMEKEALVVGTGSGLLILHSVDGNGTEIVGEVGGGVKCISPSPDGDLLAVTTGLGQLLVMTHDWDTLFETALEDYPEDCDVSESNLLSRDVLGVPISWRGDGKFFATLHKVSDSTSMRIRVWERDTGLMHAATESKNFAETILEWMPSGAKIAAICDGRTENKSPLIVFFERNGLERSSFTINVPAGSTVELLKWNCISDLLAAVVRSGKYDFVKIWHFSNNHWYLKHEIRYSRDDGVRFMWNPTKPLQLICWTLHGLISIYKFIWVTSVMENSTALVIDDSRVLVTPLSLTLVPPPMYSFSLKFPSVVRTMSLYSKAGENRLASYLSDGCLCVVEFPTFDTWDELDGREFNVEPCTFETRFGSLVHLIWLDWHILLVVSRYGHTCSLEAVSNVDTPFGFYLEAIELVCSEDHVPGLFTCSGWHAKVSTNKHLLEENIEGIAANPARRCSAFLQFDGGKVVEYVHKIGFKSDSKNDISFPTSCPWMDVALVGNADSSKPLIFGLDAVGGLHIGRRLLCSNCSSFSFYSNSGNNIITHLILATKQDLLFIIDIGDILDGEMNLTSENFTHAANRRREDENVSFINVWERGAKVVGVLHGDEACVILQTNRGNLECIYPRKLVLSSIVNALTQRRFKDALLMVRRHRIDFNVIVDHCGLQAFLESASEFVGQVNNLTYITEFICALKNTDVTRTLYGKVITLPCHEKQKEVQASDAGVCGKNKVSSVLLAIRRVLKEQVPESPTRELCILTTFARSDPPALEEALERIKNIREMELSGSNDPRRMSFPSAEDALKHLLWLSYHPEAVYEVALGLYDLNLAAIVALNSQRDPKEFLPFLQELESLPPLLMRYNVDLKLGRFEKALEHIVSAGDAHFGDSMDLMKKNPKLFRLGLQLISDPLKRKQVLEAWGDHLGAEKCFNDAATSYLCCSRLDKALKAYRACGNWSGVMSLAGLLKFGKDEVIQLARELCEELQALGKPGEAAKIAFEYCGDIATGISLLINAREWEEALRVAFMHRSEDLVSEVKKSSLECASSLIDEYNEGLEKVGKYLTRYLAVRQRRLLLAAKLRSEERSMSDLDYDDTASETSSNFSGMSVYSRGTRKSSAISTSSTLASKGRDSRRQGRKGKIRPGSPGEETALVDHLKGMCLTSGAQRELKSLLTSLVMIGEEEVSRKLQRAGENFQLSQMAAVKLAEDTASSDTIDEHEHTLARYVQKVKSELWASEAFTWCPDVLLS